MSRRILVTGATGFIGRHVVAALVRRGDRPVTLIRGSDDGFPADLVDRVRGDLTDPGSLARAADGVDAIVHLAAATTTSEAAEAQRVNVEGTRTLVDAGRAAGVSRFVAVSSVSVKRAHVGSYGETKRAMERVVLDSGLDATIVRPSLVYGPGAAGLFGRLVRTVDAIPFFPVVGRGPIRPVHVDDVVAAILRCLDDEPLPERAYDVVGPDAVTLAGLARTVAARANRRVRTVRVPGWVAAAGIRTLSAVGVRAPFTRDNVIGANQPEPGDPEPARRDLGLRPTPLAEGLATIRDPFPDITTADRPPLRLVVAGLGKMGIAHSAVLSMLPGVRIAGVVDVDPGLIRAFEGLGFHATAYASLDRALDALAPDGVVIATPTDTHLDLIRIAAARGVGVLVEKPLAHTLNAAEEIARAVARAGITASCGYTLAYLPTFEAAARMIADGVVGRPAKVEASVRISQVLGPRTGWTYDAARAGGGVIANVGSHLLFLLHQFFGDAAEILAETRRIHSAVDDEAALVVRFANDVDATVEMSWSVPGYPLSHTKITVEGDNGTVHVTNDEVTVTLGEPAAGVPAGRTHLPASALPHDAYFELGGEGYAREDEAFVAALRGESAPVTSIERALHVQRMIDAAYRSARTDAPIVLSPAPMGARA